MLEEGLVEEIKEDLRKRDITDESLLNELVDHLSCEIEIKMSQGMSFYEAFNSTIDELGIAKLSDLQEDSLKSINSDFSRRKMAYFIPLLFFCLTLVSKILRIPSVSILASLSMLSLIVILFLLAKSFWDQRSYRRNNVVYSWSMLGTSFLITIGSVLIFLNLDMQSGANNIGIGLFLLAITSCAYYFENHRTNHKEYLPLVICSVYALFGFRFFIMKLGIGAGFMRDSWVLDNDIMTPVFAAVQIGLFIPIVVYKGFYRSKMLATQILLNTIITIYFLEL